MENNEISMFMDVKLDITERKTEAVKFKSWTKCLVKIEAIKCFPCYIRITFIKDKDVQDECSNNFCVRINIPGLTIRSATSRTKQFSYGIFWKQNRKRCCIFFALDSQISYERHMKWMKKSVKNLELHRQEFIETRRNSKYNNEVSKPINQPATNDEYFKTNLQDILGPLPKIPDISESVNWSRRVSGFSGIYEEIPDIEQLSKRNSRRVSRASVASGIYEEMKPIQHSNFDVISENGKSSSEEGPPLPPPRKRINTLENDNRDGIPRCNTNPEVEMAKKKKYITVLETVFGRSKRCESVSESKVSTKDDLLINTPNGKRNDSNTPKQRRRDKNICGLDKACKKRNSFSSPDLTNINYLDEFEDLVGIDSLSSDFGDSSTSVHNVAKKPQDEDEQIKVEEKEREKPTNKNNEEKNCPIETSSLNISSKIQPDFNFSCNSSTINLVGANLNQTTAITAKLIDDLSGYCIMAPIRRNQQHQHKKKCTIVDHNDDDKENNEKFATSGIHVKHATDSVVYENMNPVMELSLLEDKNNCKEMEDEKKPQHIYQNVTENITECVAGVDKIVITSPNNEISTQIQSKNDVRKPVARKSINFDEKVPSYYPNDCDVGKSCRRTHSANNTPNGGSSGGEKNIKQRRYLKSDDDDLMKSINQPKENIYISSPLKIMEQRRKLCLNKKFEDKSHIHLTPTPLRACKIEKNMYKVTKLPENSLIITSSIPNLKHAKDLTPSPKLLSSTSSLIDTANKKQHLNAHKHENHSKINLNKKYATLARLSPQKYLEKSSVIKKTPTTTTTTATTTDLGSLKKFASLPRLKKFDFSPLKLKINAVLQRHQSDGF